MDILLLAVTVVALVVALIMCVVAWRLSRDERARSAARVAALAAAASESGPVLSVREPEIPAADTQDRRIARPAELLVDWEPVAVNDGARTAAPWAPARISAFPSEVQDRRSGEPDERMELRGQAVAPAFGAIASSSGGGRQRSLAVAACVLFVALVTGGYLTIYGGASNGAGGADRAAAPLELVSMRHERLGPKLSITGLVRNPRGGAAVERLAAVVFLFDQQSAFVTSARADVDFTKLGAGDESPFVVAVDAPAGVARYRVSFRNESGVVPHVDRRGQEPIARDLP